MKLMHISDLHIGKKLFETSMLEDQRYILNRILDLLDDERPDAVLIAGDVYDRANPTADAMELLDEFLNALAQHGVCTMIISGNHDSPERLAYARRFLENRNIHISPVYNGHIEPIALSDAYGEVCFWLMPYVHPDSVGGFFADQTIRNAQDAAQAVIGEMRVDPNKRNVILSHQFIIGGTTSDSERRNIGTLENVDAALYDAFDYVALGHIHRPQRLGRDSVRYCGSLLKYSFSEARYPKSVPLVTIGESGEPEITLLPLTPRRDLREVRGKLCDVTSELVQRAGDPNDYLRVILTDDEELYDPQAALRAVYPNLMRLDFDNIRTQTADAEGLQREEAAQQLTPVQLFEQFFAEQNGKQMTDWQKQQLARIGREMEDSDEADSCNG